MNARERILSRIQTALQTPIDEPIAKPILSHTPFKSLDKEPLEVYFATAFQKNGGHFFFCQTLEDFLGILKKWLAYQKIDQVICADTYLQQLLAVAQIDFEPDDALGQASLSLAEALIAESGSVMLSAHSENEAKQLTFPPTQIMVGFTSQLVGTLNEALQTYQKTTTRTLPAMLTIVSAPSQTTAIDQILVIGAQGAEKIVLFLIDEEVM